MIFQNWCVSSFLAFLRGFLLLGGLPGVLLAQTPLSSTTPVSPSSKENSRTFFSKQAVLLKVPFERQTEPNLCGVAAIEMVASYYSQKLNETQYQYLKLDAKQTGGITGATMEVVLRASNYYTAIFEGTLDLKLTGLYRNLDLKRPLIVMVASADGKISHYLVVTGYDPVKKLIILSDPAGGENEPFAIDEFKTGWKRANNFTLLAVPEKLETPVPGH
jgi:ABC-type bacteriocin/lantibiotic exporter with double-glycine peptidase domain